LCPAGDVQLTNFLDCQHHAIVQIRSANSTDTLKRKLFFSWQSISWCSWFVIKEGIFVPLCKGGFYQPDLEEKVVIFLNSPRISMSFIISSWVQQ